MNYLVSCSLDLQVKAESRPQALNLLWGEFISWLQPGELEWLEDVWGMGLRIEDDGQQEETET